MMQGIQHGTQPGVFGYAESRSDIARTREIRAWREREKNYRQYLEIAQQYNTGTPLPPPELAGFMHFAGVGGYPRHFGDAGGSGATLPEEATIDPAGTGSRAAAGAQLTSWLSSEALGSILVFSALGIGTLFAVGYIARSFR